MSLLDPFQIVQLAFSETNYRFKTTSIIESSSLPIGAATEVKQDTLNTLLSSLNNKLNTLGQKNSIGSVSIVLSSDQTPIAVTGSFFPTIQPISASSLPLPMGASSDSSLSIINANLTNGNQKIVGSVANASSDSGNPIKIGGIYNSNLPNFSTGQRGDAQLNKFGELSVRPRNKYSHITGNTTKLVKTGAGILSRIILGTVTAASSITIYDGIDNTGVIICVLTPISGSTCATIHFDTEVSTGITIVTSGLLLNDITVIYQ